MAEEHKCIQAPRIELLEKDIRRLEDDIDSKTAAIHTKYNGKIDTLIEKIGDLDKKLSNNTLKLSIIIGLVFLLVQAAFDIAKGIITKGL